MSMTDPIADFLARVRNGIHARKMTVECPRSNIKVRIAEILRDEGFVGAVNTAEDNKQGMIKLELRYDGRASASGCAITGMRRVSRPGQRTYVDHTHIPKVQGGMGTTIISTSKGVMTGHEARQQGVGGEVVAQVW